jgi:two-component system nitrogen regulation response regulator GlnG
LPLLPETLRFLQSLSWFGNVRELRNALEHAAILARDGPLLPEHFPHFGADPTRQSTNDELTTAVRAWLAEKVRSAGKSPQGLYEELLRLVEPALLEDVMRRLKGNRWVAAQWLGLNRATVRKKLALYGLADVDGEEDEEG